MAEKQTKIKYYHLSDTPNSRVKSGNLLKKEIARKSDYANPLFNFSREFTDALKSINNLDLAQSAPYISLKVVDFNGKVLTDLNVEYFSKPLDYNKINDSTRYNERPVLSLKSVTIDTDQGPGYLYEPNVTLELKVHKKNDLSDTTLLALLFPRRPS